MENQEEAFGKKKNKLDIYPVRFDDKGNMLGASLPIGERREDYYIRTPTMEELDRLKKEFGANVEHRRIAIKKDSDAGEWN
ncbi:MAG: hypothetical protein KGJ89_04195 [Patescibacteria group bacterium]|nr:hypothetical protein [Patescibacteria group bacterium]MDE2015325.1 hypothetical protein [Patescibacteria group bacterium]MDE2227130.1 hypothetical protein [Patescibacteria group bacterium]